MCAPIPQEPSSYFSGQQDIKLTLEPAANIEGKVIVAATGQPLSGVKLRWLVTNDLREPVVERRGRRVSPGGHRPGKGCHYRRVSGRAGRGLGGGGRFGDGGVRGNEEGRAGPRLEGRRGGDHRMSRNDRKSVAEVPVAVSSQLSPSPIVAMTGADGVARLRLLPDRWRVSVSEGGRNGAQPDVTVVTGQTNDVQVLVDPGLKITGMVRDAEGAPVGGAVVSVYGNAYRGSQNGRQRAVRI